MGKNTWDRGIGSRGWEEIQGMGDEKYKKYYRYRK
jgi:hypothetical protein